MQIKILTIYTRSQVYLWPDCIFLNMYSFQIFNECQFYCKRVLWHKKASGLIRALCTFIYLTKLYEMYFCHILNWMEIINRRPVSFTVSTFSNWNSSIRNVCPFSPVYSITIINMDSWVLSLIWGVIICYCHNLFEHVLLKCPDSLFCSQHLLIFQHCKILQIHFCVFPALTQESVIPPKNMVPFIVEWHLKTKIVVSYRYQSATVSRNTTVVTYAGKITLTNVVKYLTYPENIAIILTYVHKSLIPLASRGGV